jgi:hypothetical protein
MVVLPATPFVWLVLAGVGIVVLLARRGSEGRIALWVGTVFSGLLGVFGVWAVMLMAQAGLDGADFGYPAAPPVPAFGAVVEEADGFDDDDPMRGREVLIDIGDHTQADLVDYYRRQFTEADGWLAGTAGPDDVGGGLCLVNHSDDRYDEYVEVYKYDGVFAGRSGRPGHYLVSISRLSETLDGEKRTADRCVEASTWYPTNL